MIEDNPQVTSRYHYDRLDRLTQTDYTGSPDGIATPSVTYTYDAHNPSIAGVTSYPKGRLTRVDVAGGTTTAYDSFDAIGRVTRSRQMMADTTTYRFGDDTTAGYVYTVSGALLSIRYPSGRTIATTYDGLNRAKTLTGILNGTATNYVTAAT